MKLNNDWLWDRKITIANAQSILKNSQDKRFLKLAALLFARKNTPREVFKYYIKPLTFVKNWLKIKRRMRKDAWSNPRIEYWQVVYEVLREKFVKKKINLKEEAPIKKRQSSLLEVIVQRLRSLRKQKGWTQGQMASKLKVSQQVISRIEKGRENVSLNTLKRITDALGARLQIEIK